MAVSMQRGAWAWAAVAALFVAFELDFFTATVWHSLGAVALIVGPAIAATVLSWYLEIRAWDRHGPQPRSLRPRSS